MVTRGSAEVELAVAELKLDVFLAHAKALERLGLWEKFVRENGDLLESLKERLA